MNDEQKSATFEKIAIKIDANMEKTLNKMDMIATRIETSLARVEASFEQKLQAQNKWFLTILVAVAGWVIAIIKL